METKTNQQNKKLTLEQEQALLSNNIAATEFKTAELSATEKAELKVANAKKLEKAKIEAAQTGSYLPKAHERHLFHVKMDKPGFNPATGEKIFKPFIQMYTMPEWNMFEKNGNGLGFITTVMWNPKLYK